MTVPVTPAVHDVQVRYSLSAPFSQLQVDTRSGPQTVYFRSSWSGWTSGAIGLAPVNSPGLVPFLTQLAVSFALLAGMIGVLAWLFV